MIRRTHRARKIAVIDAETDPFKYGRIPRPFVWGFYDGERYLEFEYRDDLADFLEKERLIVYAHNGGRFDYHFLFEYVDFGEEVTVINGRVAKMKIGGCELRDSWNILPVPLAEMQKDEIDYRIMEREERDKPANREKISNYLRSDCIYLWNWVMAFRGQYGNGLTLAGCAMHYWKKLSQCDPPRDHQGALYTELRHYYHGGRTQAFDDGEFDGPLYLADINSAYPYAMIHEHPIGLSYYVGFGTTEWNSLPIRQRETSMVTLQGIANGCFPVRDGDGLKYPTDGESRQYNVTGWEYIAAKETGSFKGRIKDFFYFDVLTDFKEYVTHFFNMKKEAQKGTPEYQFAKLFMNALYGKFASNPDEYSEYMVGWHGMLDDNGEAQQEGTTWCYAGEFGEDGESILIERPQPEEKQKFYNLATAASITGFVRAYLWRAIHSCKGVIYCDTDSIVARDVNTLEFGSELGQWDLEGEFDYGAIGGRKLYAFHYKDKPRAFSFEKKETRKNWKIASKGVKITPNQIRKVARGETVRYEPQAPTFSIYKGPYFIARNVKKTKK